MTTRRAFLAAAFGAATARALRKPKYWAGIDCGCDDHSVVSVFRMSSAVLIDRRQAQVRIDFLNPSFNWGLANLDVPVVHCDGVSDAEWERISGKYAH